MTAYYIEVLDSLRVVDIYVECAGPKRGSGGDEIQLIGATELRISLESVISLPVAVLPRAAMRSFLDVSDSRSASAQVWVRIRAPIASDIMKARLEQASQLITNIGKPIAASAIQGLCNVSCQSCSSSLFVSTTVTAEDGDSSHTLKIRDLPSAFWSELVDCWVCHPEKDTVNVNTDLLHVFEPEITASDDAKASTVNPKTHADTKPAVDMWVGDTYVLAAERLFRDLPRNLVHIDTKGRFHGSYVELCCDSCSRVVGEAGRMGSKKMAKLCLNRVQFELPNPSPAISVTLSAAVCREILSHAGAHAVYRFVVEGRKSCQPVALIHVVGWNVEIQARAATSAHADIAGRCIKVLFTQAGTSAFDSQAKQWLDDSATELISLFDADADKLLCVLSKNAQLLPPPLRGMANMTRTFLEIA
ncbi:E3 ubiquitin-protein ligase E3D [Coemansia sp. BCRC 34301]|nr:E3 ubiquitin-protein ligase E3D [Coemansia sp. BCRC 34301]